MDLTLNLQEKPNLENIARVWHEGGHYQYLLPSLWSLHLYEYHGRLVAGHLPFEIYPGNLTLVPPGTPMEFDTPNQALHYFVHFKLPAPVPDETVLLPLSYDVRGDLYHFEQTIIAIGRAFLYRSNRLQAEVALWYLLWELVNCGQSSLGGRHTSLEKALALIDARLGEPISVNALAHEVGLSRNHLTRLFRQEKHLTVVAYVRQQRARRAKHLLQNTTMSLLDIASQINSPNLQSFSTLIKKETGQSPGYWRRHRE